MYTDIFYAAVFVFISTSMCVPVVLVATKYDLEVFQANKKQESVTVTVPLFQCNTNTDQVPFTHANTNEESLKWTLFNLTVLSQKVVSIKICAKSKTS